MLWRLLIYHLSAAFALNTAGQNVSTFQLITELAHIGGNASWELLQIDIRRHTETQIALIAVHPAGKFHLRLAFGILLQGEVDIANVNLLVVGTLPDQQTVHHAKIIDIKFPRRLCRLFGMARGGDRCVRLGLLFTVGRQADNGVFQHHLFHKQLMR
ncbi:hypothetical protein D3C78_1463500 [compost metagenome]